MNLLTKVLLPAFIFVVPYLATAQTPATKPTEAVPDWAQPGTATHKQVAPPSDYHKPTRTTYKPIGIFTAQSDIGSPLIEGSATYDAATKAYTIHSAGYNIWYMRDEFRYLWKKVSGDVSMAANITYTDVDGYEDRKAVLVIRQSLDDDAKEAVVALHGAGMFHLAWRPEKSVKVVDMEYRVGSRGALPGGKNGDDLVTAHPKRIGIEKRGDSFALFVSMNGEPMHQFGEPIKLKIKAPFYAGIGFCSHVPDKADKAILSDVVFVNKAGMVR
ncbi:MAG: hypothetical protein ABI367_05850 [Mucilaginibacter sp.]